MIENKNLLRVLYQIISKKYKYVAENVKPNMIKQIISNKLTWNTCENIKKKSLRSIIEESDHTKLIYNYSVILCKYILIFIFVSV